MHGRGLKGPANGMHGKRKDQAPRWGGGRKSHAGGYVLVMVPDDHPYPSRISKAGTKYILEHRFVMEQHLGRYLEPGEVVHHIDGDKSNNRIENLQLFASQAEHMANGHRRAKELQEEVQRLRDEIARLRDELAGKR